MALFRRPVRPLDDGTYAIELGEAERGKRLADPAPHGSGLGAGLVDGRLEPHPTVVVGGPDHGDEVADSDGFVTTWARHEGRPVGGAHRDRG